MGIKSKYLLTLGGCPLPNRVYPVLKGSCVKGGKIIFSQKNNRNTFFDESTFFDYLILENFEEAYLHQDPWKMVDIHRWISPGLRDTGAISFGISPKLKEIFENYNMVSYIFYGANLMYKNQKHEFWIWQIKENSYLSFIDWEKCLFTDWDMMRTNKRGNNIYSFSSNEEYVATTKRMYGLGFEKAVFYNCFQENDLCFFPKVFPAYTFIISERLKQAIESVGIEGVVIKELPFEIAYSNSENV